MATKVLLDTVTQAELGNKGLVVTIYQDDDILGHLMVGKASLVWFEKSAKKRGRKVTWNDFHAWIMAKNEVAATRP
ncbi:MAG: hypothetical protein IPG63_17790 [Xanthomonadales bacterium]|nr:hypothetical protein [Xanthomonadales bacterium]MBK7145615.1 hypothetical protein [Xanthomonadales bacterium]